MGFTENGIYNARSGYQVVANFFPQNANPFCASSSTSPAPKKIWNLIWHINAPPKVKLFLWRLCTNSIATSLNLFQRKCSQSPAWTICFEAAESVTHMLFGCQWTNLVWFASPLTVRSSLYSSSSVQDFIQALIDQAPSQRVALDTLTTFAFTSWTIWKARNAFVFEQKMIFPYIVHSISQSSHHEFTSLFCSNAPDSTASIVSPKQWPPPPANIVKFNCDGSFKDGIGSIGVLGKNNLGTLIDGNAKLISATSALQAEVLAIWEACQLAFQRQSFFAHIESDCSIAKSLAKSTRAPPWHVALIIEDIRAFASKLNLSFYFIPRSFNAPTHWLAKMARSMLLPTNWVVCTPCNLSSLLRCDYA